MSTEQAIIRNCSELSPGDRIEAWRDGRLIHRGRVLAVIPELDLFWIQDTRTGTRQLLDLAMLRVLRCPVWALPDLHGPDPSVA